VRRLGALNEQKVDFEAAIGWYQDAANLTKGTDIGGFAEKNFMYQIKRVAMVNARRNWASTDVSSSAWFMDNRRNPLWLYDNNLAKAFCQNTASQKTFTLRLFFSRNLRGNC